MLRQRSPKDGSQHSLRMIARLDATRSKGDHRVDARRPSRGQIAGKGRHGQQQDHGQPDSGSDPSAAVRRGAWRRIGRLASAAATPTTTPMATSRAIRASPCDAVRRRAPRAMRMPISVVRRVTLYDIRPNSPIAATSSARPPNKRVGLSKDAFLGKPALDMLHLRRHVHERHVRIHLSNGLANCAGIAVADHQPSSQQPPSPPLDNARKARISSPEQGRATRCTWRRGRRR